MTFFQRYRRSIDWYTLAIGFISLLALAAVLLTQSCGDKKSPPKPQPMDVAKVCDKAVKCSVFMEQQRGACEACLEHVDSDVLTEAYAVYPSLPPLDGVPCDYIRNFTRSFFIIDKTQPSSRDGSLNACVIGIWYGPFGR